MQNLSERLFAAICHSQGYSTDKIPTDEKPSPDFRVCTPYGCVIAEVKELSPNKEEKELLRREATGEIVGFGGTIGARARGEIRKASKQLRRYHLERVPSLVVLYSNITPSVPMLHLQWFDIDAAMNGQWITYLSPQSGRPPLPDRNGGKRGLTENNGCYVSAVAVISNTDNKTLLIYHNPHAETPLPGGLFAGSTCIHFRKPLNIYDAPNTWIPFRNS